MPDREIVRLEFFSSPLPSIGEHFLLKWPYIQYWGMWFTSNEREKSKPK
jgi:hypothetical protein